MKKLRSKLTRPMCLVLALLVMGGSMAAAALTGSPYDVLKDATFNLLTAESGTYRVSGEMLVDGVSHEMIDSQYMQFSPDGSYNSYEGGVSDKTVHYNQNGLNLNRYDTGDRGMQWRANYYPSYGDYSSNTLSGYSRSDTYVRLMELALDMLAGDLKNNIGMTHADGIRTMSATYTAQQIPELFNAALTVMLSQSTSGYYNSTETVSQTDTTVRYRQTRYEGREKIVTEREETGSWQYYDPQTGAEISADDPRATDENRYFYTESNKQLSETRTAVTREDYYGQDVLEMPIEKAVIDYGSGTARVDSDGNPVDATASLRLLLTNIFGDEHEVEFNFSLTCENINSTVVECPIPGAQELFTEEFFKEMYSGIEGYSDGSYGTLEFDLNDDGTVNVDSIRIPETRGFNETAYVREIYTDSGIQVEYFDDEAGIPADYIEIP